MAEGDKGNKAGDEVKGLLGVLQYPSVADVFVGVNYGIHVPKRGRGEGYCNRVEGRYHRLVESLEGGVVELYLGPF